MIKVVKLTRKSLIRLFYTITIGLALGFGIFAATASLYIMLLGQPLPDFLFIPTYIVAYIIAFYVGNKVVGKEERIALAKRRD